ncbi:gliding motility-associated C-terminal domain-containing protein [uncultured Winogradskyella sp.]|uniref:T9SS type B sorting domain-containing protein n=1 Tax=uncultured Winogradskyella sp. TaxID=395353 RepID=UPI00261C602A|nr:gliding motility-associated C-terminal domain-containing protein [uncultured Winogradskyella sp.]
MRAKSQSFKTYYKLLVFLLLLFTYGLSSVNAQCPTVTNNFQSLCDIESVLVGDLEAIDNGGGIVWYETATSTVPLSNLASLISGEDYYADDNTGMCGARQRVDVIIYGPPTGQNFQGVCLDDPTLATVADLQATGNDVQWYLSPSGGVPLSDSTILIDDTLYYADQANPDTGCRTSRLTVLVKVGFTPVPTGDAVQEFCVTSEFTPTVGDLVATGTNNWYISLFSAFALPSNTPLINGQVYYGTSLDPPCESFGRLGVLVILNNGLDPGNDAILELCDSDVNSPVDLFTLLGGSPQSGGTWSPMLNSGTGVYDPSIDPDGIYTYTLTSTNSCPDESSTVTVTTTLGPDAGTNGTAELCSIDDSIDLFNSLGGTPDIGGIWSPALASGTGEFNPSIDNAGIYTYTVSGTAPCNDVSATVTISVTQFLDAGEDGTIEICDSDGTIDLFNSLGGNPDTGGIWTPALNSGTGVFDPLVDTQSVYTYSFTGNTPCPDTSSTVTITVNPLPDAGSNAILDLCSNDTASVDLFDSLGGTPETGGTWSPTLTSGTGIFDPTADAPGVYTYTLTGIAPCPNVSATVNVSIIQEPNAGIDATVEICDNTGTIDLFDSLEGAPDLGGTWLPALASGTGIFDPTIDADGIYTYTVVGTTPCADASATVTISVTPFLVAGLNGALTICTDDTPVDLINSLGGTPDVGGTWSPALASGTGIFDPSLDSGGIYTYTTSPGGPCANDSATVIVTLEIAPDAGNDGTLTICNTANSVDLFNSLGGTPDIGGVWSPILISGTGIFDPSIDPEGIYTYTISSICGNSSTTVTVSVDESNSAGSNGAIELCTNDSIVDLFNSLGGTPDTGGTWSPMLASGTGVFDPSVDSGGTYTYTVSNSTTLCPDASAVVIVTVLQEPDAGSNGTLNLCNASNSVDLYDSLAGTPQTGGTWSPTLTSGTGIFDPNIDPEGVYTYTVTSACGTSSATVTVSLTNLNDAGTNGSIDLCNNDAAVDLFNSLGGTPQSGGTWSPALNSGTGIFDPSIDSAGTYTYTISNSSSLCPAASAAVTVTVIQEPDAGSNGTLNLCNASNSVDLFDSLAGTPQTGGTWSPTLASGTGIFDPNIDAEGVYTYTVTSTCGISSATVTVSLTNLNDAGTNGSIDLCENDTAVDLFNSLGGTPQPGGTWSPTLASGTGIFDPNIDSASTYTYTISNSSSLCSAASATVTVTVLQEPDAGNDGTLNLCNATNSVDLFDSLAGTPQTGGTWSPTLNSGTGIFDPNIDPEGNYTYTINSSCGTSSATVNVTFSELNDAGINGSIDLCDTDVAVDLFNSLGGTPQPGGTWSPALNSGTGIFDPNIDAAGTYTYSISNSSSLCPPASASVTVSLTQALNAGDDGILNFCNGTIELVDLFDSLGGMPDTGGTWSPMLNSGTGVFNPSIDNAGIYTYTITSICGNSSATVTVIIDQPNDAGSDGLIELCSNGSAVDLFDSLGGTPQLGGTWSPALTSGTGIFDPTLDSSGTYVYTVSGGVSTCPAAIANVTVSIVVPPNAGIDSTLNLCIDDLESVDLFESLGGTPEGGGTWSPALNSGTGIFDPNIDVQGIYTYTVNSAECGLTASANVTVIINDLPDASGLEMSIEDNVICLGFPEDVVVDITGANQLPDGDYTIVYLLTEANVSLNTTAITISGGNSSFIVAQNLLPNPGITLVTLSQLFFIGQTCSAVTDFIEPAKILVEEVATPQIIDNGGELCEEDIPTIANLTANIIDSEIIIWYDEPVGGNSHSDSEVLEDGQTYYASIQSENGCESTIRLEVTVSLIECIGDLLIPDGFSPNGDSINDVFDILFLDDLYPKFKLSIYNRYGNILYEGDINSPKWDGTWKNNDTLLPVGVYFYILEFNDGEREPLQGRVYLSR